MQELICNRYPRNVFMDESLTARVLLQPADGFAQVGQAITYEGEFPRDYRPDYNQQPDYDPAL
jgi:hypothetical protein